MINSEYYKQCILDKGIMENIHMLELVFNAIGQELSSDDWLFFVVSNHGDKNGIINIWGDDEVWFDEIEQLLNNIKAKKIIIMGQCYCGEYLKLNTEKTCIITADAIGDCTYVRIDNKDYDEFFYLFFSYLNGNHEIPQMKNNIRSGRIN